MAAADQSRDAMGRFVRDADAGVRGIDALASRASLALSALNALGGGAGHTATSLLGVGNSAGAAAGLLSGLGTIVGVVTLAFAALTAVASGVGFGVKLAAEAEQTQIAFETMLGSASEARALIGDLRSFAIETPFREDELISAGRALVSFGEESQDVVTVLRRIGDVSAGVNQPIGEIAEIYGKARVQGRLFMQDINQLTGRGIPVIQELGKQFGVTESEVRKLVESGQVEFAHLEEAFRSLTSGSGDFTDLTAKQSESLLGKWSSFQDSVSGSLREVGTRFLETGLAQEAMAQGQRFVSAAFALGQGFIDAYGGTVLKLAQTCLNMTGVLVDLAEAVLGIDSSAKKATEATRQQEIRAEAASAAMREQAEAAKQLTDMQDRYATKAERLAATLAKIQQIDAAGDTLANLSRRAMLQETGLGSELDRLATEIDILEGRTTAIQAKAAAFAKAGADAGHVRRFVEMAEQAEALKEAHKAAEDRQKAMKKEEERTRKLDEELKRKEKDRAKEIFESTRTPAEQLKSGLQEIVQLRNKGHIDNETFARRARQLGEDFRNAMPKPQEWQPNVAVEARTSEAVSIAIAATSRKPRDTTEDLLNQLLQEAKDQLTEQERQTSLLDQRLKIYETGSAF